MRRSVATASIGALIALSAAVPADAALFNASDIRVDGIVQETIAEDLDGDGMEDILVLHATGFYPEERRWISIFLQKGSGRFESKPNQTIPAPEDAVLMDTSDLLGDNGKEIVFMTSNGASFLPMKEGSYDEPRRLIRRETLIALPDSGALPHYDFVRDWNGDGSEEIALFLPGAVELYRTNGGDPIKMGDVTLDIKASMRAQDRSSDPFENFSIGVGYRVPELLTADYDGDGKPDLWAIQRDIISIYLQGEDGAFSANPARRIDLYLLTEEDYRKGDATLFIRVTDLDGDGLVDLAASKMKGRVSDFTSRVAIYMGRDKALETGRPSQVITAEDVTGTALIDANNDGRMDLVLASTSSNILSYVKVLLTHDMSFQFRIHMMRGDGRYSEEPDYVRSDNFHLNLKEGVLSGMLPRYSGDFDGDGSRDIIFATSDDQLSFVLTGYDRGLPKRPQHVERMLVSDKMVVADLDGDGKSEIIFRYGTRPEMEGLVRIFHNSGRWKDIISTGSASPEQHEMGRIRR